VTVRVHYFNQNYDFQVNTRTCAIVNGSEIVAQELRRFQSWNPNFLDMVEYFRPNSGQAEGFRHTVEDNLTSATNCFSVYYQISTEYYMDTSGLGNVVFGYYMSWSNQTFEDIVSNLDQGVNRETFGHAWDNPDDTSQRRMGRRIAEAVDSGDSIDSSLVESAAQQADLR